MRRIYFATTVVCAALAFASHTSLGQTSERAQLTSSLSIAASGTSDDLRLWDRFVTDEARAGTLRLRTQTIDPLLPQRTVERFEQTYSGVRIWGTEVIRDSERGIPVSIFGVVVPNLHISVSPGLSTDRARTVLARGDGDAVLLTSPELTIVGLAGGTYQLAFQSVVAAHNHIDRVFIDADGGAELLRYSEVQGDGAIGTGTGVLGDRKKISVDSSGGTFVAFDRLRPPIIETFDMKGNLNRTKALERGLLPYTLADLASDSDNVWMDPAVVDAHVHVSWTYDFYYKRFGRSGLDGRNGPIDIVVNAVSQKDSLNLSTADFDTYAINASWCSVCGPGGRGRMIFGNGFPSNLVLTSGQNFTMLAGALDVAAHELTHAVTSATSRLIYSRESGALNEAFSDMMGKSAEFYFHPAGSGVGQADYVIGKDVVRGLRAGSLNGIRSMANPGQYGDPDHYARYRNLPPTPDGDNGGVHTNSGIANNAFYLAIEGGTNRTSGLSVQGVGAGNREQIEKVFYRAFTLLLPATATFYTARSATTQAARDLFGAGSAAERAVTQAWTAVGVPDPAAVGAFVDVVPSQRSITYVITMNSTGRYQALLSWNDIVSNDLDLFLTPTNCPPSRSGCILDQSTSDDSFESVSTPVRAGERYWLTINNYRGPAAAFSVRHFVSAVVGSSSEPGARVGLDKAETSTAAAGVGKP